MVNFIFVCHRSFVKGEPAIRARLSFRALQTNSHFLLDYVQNRTDKIMTDAKAQVISL